MSSKVLVAGIVESALSVDRLLRSVSAPSVGGIALFVGVVRDRDSGQDVTSLDYSQHPAAAETLRRCAEEVAARHEVIAVAVEHRVGHLEIGDLAVVVAVGSEHRQAALAACAELIEVVKHTVPIWKEQHLATGATQWIGLDDADAVTESPAR